MLPKYEDKSTLFRIINSVSFPQRELAKHTKLINNVQTDEVALDEKIAKRAEEKDRHQRRLDMLKSVR